jgi:hypothetical protein
MGGHSLRFCNRCYQYQQHHQHQHLAMLDYIHATKISRSNLGFHSILHIDRSIAQRLFASAVRVPVAVYPGLLAGGEASEAGAMTALAMVENHKRYQEGLLTRQSSPCSW